MRPLKAEKSHAIIVNNELNETLVPIPEHCEQPPQHIMKKRVQSGRNNYKGMLNQSADFTKRGKISSRLQTNSTPNGLNLSSTLNDTLQYADTPLN